MMGRGEFEFKWRRQKVCKGGWEMKVGLRVKHHEEIRFSFWRK